MAGRRDPLTGSHAPTGLPPRTTRNAKLLWAFRRGMSTQDPEELCNAKLKWVIYARLVERISALARLRGSNRATLDGENAGFPSLGWQTGTHGRWYFAAVGGARRLAPGAVIGILSVPGPISASLDQGPSRMSGAQDTRTRRAREGLLLGRGVATQAIPSLARQVGTRRIPAGMGATRASTALSPRMGALTSINHGECDGSR
jgi:hypothetical protein